ncbi:hypothetical protein [Sinomicrobium soli]|uniref:hypothetical protein n=1 Tax=Sinomicrobium sp. N-1-3-6 TaxID=2219864 RepID=UPI0011BE1BAB|nr:hypothetical protein [Sinomicrobium sp. N-1-3-6]
MAQETRSVYRKTVTVGGQDSRAAYGGFVDLRRGKVYTLDEATAVQDQVDMLYGYGKNTKSNIMAVSSRSRDYFGRRYRDRLHEWTELNRGTFIAVENTREQRKIFKEIQTAGQLRQAFEAGLKTVENRPDYDRGAHGPSSHRLRRLKENEMIYFKSIYREGVYAAFKVVEIREGEQGYIKLDLITVGN